MLVLSRALQERIVLELPNGELVQIVLCEIGSRTAKIGIEARRDIPVFREEVWVRRERRQKRKDRE